MVYRVHFTTKDLARTRLAHAPMPLEELDLAARAFQDRSQAARLDAWRARARDGFPAGARRALALVPSVGWSYEFVARVGSPEELLEEARAMSRRDICTRLARLASRQPLPSWTRRMVDDAELYREFIDGFAGLYDVLLRPYEAQLAELFTADRSVRSRQFLDGGVELLLARANPKWMRWNPPTLEIRMANGIDADLYLRGQGILLMPSMFGDRSILNPDAEPQPIVSYPAGLDQPLRRLTSLVPADTKSRSATAALFGTTRAAVLTTIAEYPGCSTKELATLAGIAPASASEHATVLRRAGLVNTLRHRSTVIHSPTRLGIALLNRASA